MSDFDPKFKQVYDDSDESAYSQQSGGTEKDNLNAAEYLNGYLLNEQLNLDVNTDINNERHFFITDYHELELETVQEWLIITPPALTPPESSFFHMIICIDSDTSGVFELYEDSTTISDGIPLEAFNSDRNSFKITTLTAFNNPEIDNIGMLLSKNVVGSRTEGPSLKFGNQGEMQVLKTKIILKTNAKYFIRFTADLEQARVNTCLSFSEITTT